MLGSVASQTPLGTGWLRDAHKREGQQRSRPLDVVDRPVEVNPKRQPLHRGRHDGRLGRSLDQSLVEDKPTRQTLPRRDAGIVNLPGKIQLQETNAGKL